MTDAEIMDDFIRAVLAGNNPLTDEPYATVAKYIRQLSTAAGNCRPEVLAFAGEMERKLRQNDHKLHWRECALPYLRSCLDGEVAELRAANSLDAIRAEAADVANLAMMIADQQGALTGLR